MPHAGAARPAAFQSLQAQRSQAAAHTQRPPHPRMWHVGKPGCQAVGPGRFGFLAFGQTLVTPCSATDSVAVCKRAKRRATRFATLMALTRTNFTKGLPMKSERKIEPSKPVPMYDTENGVHQVVCFTTLVRFHLLDGTWTPWGVQMRRLMCGQTPVNQLEDGWYELASPGTRIRPTQPVPWN